VRGPAADEPEAAAAPANDSATNWRLQQLAAAVRRHTEPAKRPREADPEMEARLSARAAALPWPLRETPHGPLHVVERWLEPQHCHGRVVVRSALDRLPQTLAALALDSALEGLDLSRMLFLDTETTGLSGGTGTVAFLVGLAQFDEGTLKLTQLLVPNLGGELPMLVELAARLEAASCILTYNGKSFDWPLLRTRYVLHRLPVPPLPPHVDLLHATRRIWKPRLGSLRLTDIERQILHFFRDDDVDGAEIPSRYFAFLRDGASERLVPVLEHNQNDLIALPAMLGTLGERFERIECGEEVLDALAFGRLSLRVQDVPRAQAFARLAIETSEGSALSGHAWSFSGDVERRFGDAAAAVAHYEQALGLAGDARQAAALRVVLAKLYEHALRDACGAYRHARHTEPAEGPLAHGRRLGRLWRKLERQAARKAR
ncbi:MAG TPA: ribonuclease H-like domain-containing protein, partial [Polyangiales bacterium]|nr:ribonuclease H-like domain-containing protein [Polyangiales bacterium]